MSFDYVYEHAKEMANLKISTDIWTGAARFVDYEAYRSCEEGSREGEDDDDYFFF